MNLLLWRLCETEIFELLFFLNLNSISVHTETFVKMVTRREQTLIVQA